MIASAEKEHSDREQQLQLEITKLQSQLDKLKMQHEASMEEHRLKEEVVRQQVEILELTAINLKYDTSITNQDIAMLMESRNSIQDSIDAMMQQKEKRIKTLSNLGKEIEVLKAQKLQFSSLARAAEEELDQLEDEVEKLKVQQTKLKEEVAVAEATIKKAEGVNIADTEKLKNQLQITQQMAQNMKQQIETLKQEAASKAETIKHYAQHSVDNTLYQTLQSKYHTVKDIQSQFIKIVMEPAATNCPSDWLGFDFRAMTERDIGVSKQWEDLFNKLIYSLTDLQQYKENEEKERKILKKLHRDEFEREQQNHRWENSTSWAYQKNSHDPRTSYQKFA